MLCSVRILSDTHKHKKIQPMKLLNSKYEYTLSLLFITVIISLLILLLNVCPFLLTKYFAVFSFWQIFLQTIQCKTIFFFNELTKLLALLYVRYYLSFTLDIRCCQLLQIFKSTFSFKKIQKLSKIQILFLL